MSDWNEWDDWEFDPAQPDFDDAAGNGEHILSSTGHELFNDFADEFVEDDGLTGDAGAAEHLRYGVDPHVDEPYGDGVESGMGPAGVRTGLGPADAPIGADPDVHPYDGVGSQQVFPEMLGFGDLLEPVDGFPWIDPAALGGPELPDLGSAYLGVPEPVELADYAREELPADVDPWSALARSADPATSNLARWWAPR
jgi:hypothetical protein